MNKNYFALLIFAALVFPPLLYLLQTEVLLFSGFLEIFYIIASIVAYVTSLGLIASCVWQADAVEFANVTPTSKPPRKIVLYTILIFLLIAGTIAGKRTKFIYNESTIQTAGYNQTTNELRGFYDGMWKTYSQKKSLTDEVKPIFMELARIQMSARIDGQSVAWKWVSENTHIPFGEFTAFYTDLSNFVTTQRREYFEIEKRRQLQATNHNLLIDTFPNNVYNVFIGRKHIDYKYGFLSDSTNKVFSSGVENLPDSTK